VVDFPDPTNYSLGKLYTTTFYRLLARHLTPHALMAVQSTSPLFARRTYWCIVETIKQAGFDVHPYHAYVPAFGEWGFVLGALTLTAASCCFLLMGEEGLLCVLMSLPLAVPLPVEPREELPSDPVSHWIRKAGCAPESAEFADAIRECPVLQRSDLQFAVKRVAFTSDRRARLAIGAPPGKCVKLVFRRAQGRPLASQGDCVPGLLSPRPTSGK